MGPNKARIKLNWNTRFASTKPQPSSNNSAQIDPRILHDCIVIDLNSDEDF